MLTIEDKDTHNRQLFDDTKTLDIDTHNGIRKNNPDMNLDGLARPSVLLGSNYATWRYSATGQLPVVQVWKKLKDVSQERIHCLEL